MFYHLGQGGMGPQVVIEQPRAEVFIQPQPQVIFEQPRQEVFVQPIMQQPIMQAAMMAAGM
jgi:hypothetical protein